MFAVKSVTGILFGALLVATSAVSATTNDSAAQLEGHIAREHAAGRFAGVVLVGRGDAISFTRAIGLADREAGVAHRVDETWRWASVSKQVAAVLAMQQVERGAMTLDTTVHATLPEFGAPNAARITIRDLLRHTSGLPNPDDSASGAMPSFYTSPVAAAGGVVEAGLAYCAGMPKAAPGAGFSYNNCDTLVLQAMLEKRTGKPYRRLLGDELIAPLTLRSVSIVDTDGMHDPRVPVGYLDTGKREPPINLATFGAAGAMTGTAADLWAFDRALMQGQLLNPTSRMALWQGDPKLGYVALGVWSFPAKLSGCDQPLQLIERRGEIGGIQVRNLMAPQRQAALIVFSNTAATDFGELWQGKGFGFDLASAAFCGST